MRRKFYKKAPGAVAYWLRTWRFLIFKGFHSDICTEPDCFHMNLPLDIVAKNFCGVEFLLFGDIVLANAGGGWLDLNLGK